MHKVTAVGCCSAPASDPSLVMCGACEIFAQVCNLASKDFVLLVKRCVAHWFEEPCTRESTLQLSRILTSDFAAQGSCQAAAAGLTCGGCAWRHKLKQTISSNTHTQLMWSRHRIQPEYAFAHPRSSPPFHSQIPPFIHSALAEIANLTLMPCSPLALSEPSLNLLCCSPSPFPPLSPCSRQSAFLSHALSGILCLPSRLLPLLLIDIRVGTRQVQKAFAAFTVITLLYTFLVLVFQLLNLYFLLSRGGACSVALCTDFFFFN